MSSVDLCAGPGGWEVAASWLDLGDVVGIELDGQAAALRDAAGFATVQSDVMLLDPLVFGPVDGVIGSPPCPTFSRGSGAPAVRNLPAILSVAHAFGRGEDRRHLADVEDDRDLLVVEPLRWALDLHPEWIALEQVPAALRVWETIADVLRQHGYAVWTGELNARDYGVAQDRRRAVLIARADGPVGRPAELADVVRPSDLFAPRWQAEDLVGFPRRADGGGAIELNGVSYRARDLRRASEPVFTLTSKSRSWTRIATDGTRHPIELSEAIALQGFPPSFPFDAAESRSAAFEHLANTVPPPLAAAVLREATR